MIKIKGKLGIEEFYSVIFREEPITIDNKIIETNNVFDNSKYIAHCNNNVSIALNFHICGVLSYYQRKVIEKVGLFDGRFRNAFEHINYTYRIIKAGYHPPFWWFTDVADSIIILKI